MVTFGHSGMFLAAVTVMATMWSATRGSEYNCTVPTGGNCTFDTPGCNDQLYSPDSCFEGLHESVSNLTSIPKSCFQDSRNNPTNTSILRPTDLVVTVEPNNVDTYLLRISWTPVLPIIPSYLLGYYVLVTEDNNGLPNGCVQLAPTVSSVVFVMEFAADQIDVSIKTIPNNIYNPLIHSMKAPAHCHDFSVDDSIKFSRCGPPTPKPPTLNGVYCLIPSANNDTMSLRLSWEPPTMPAGYPCCSRYYVLFSSNVSSDPVTVLVEGTSLTEGTSLILQPLSTRVEYYISLQPFMPCAFDEFHGTESCGTTSWLPHHQISNCNDNIIMVTSSPASSQTSPSPPNPTTTPQTSNTSSSTSPSDIPSTTPTPIPVLRNPIYYIVLPIIVVAVLFGLALVILCVVYRFSRRHHRYLPTIVRDPCELAHLEPGCSLPPSPTPSPLSPPSPLPLPPPLPSAGTTHKVVVVFSEKIPEKIKQRIYVCLVCGLKEYGISVTCYDLAHRRATASWIEEMAGNASVVLAVCDEWFKDEWLNGGGASVVHALHQTVLAETTSGRQLDSKYAVVLTHKDDEQYIPGLLGNTVRFIITETDRMVRYIQQTHKYA